MTSSLPLDKWYVDETSEWTLDYPPFFAYFEYMLSLLVRLVDPAMLQLTNLNYSSSLCILVHRSTVLLSESILYYSLYKWLNGSSKQTHVVVVASILLNAGLIMVDNVHFQYNGFLFGVLIWSIVEMKRRPLVSALLFSVLIHLKHIYLYVAPAYFVYLLRSHVFQSSFDWFKRLVQLGSIVVGVTCVSLGPFVWNGTLMHVVKRLFPFKRGLCHAYWAPNVWALYAAVDRVLMMSARVLGWMQVDGEMSSMTRGVVGDVAFGVLPNIPPWFTFVATLISILPALVKLWFKPTVTKFQSTLVLCAFGSFLFGWHVHEKAVLIIILPLTLISHLHVDYYRAFVFASLAGQYALFPLLFGWQEVPIRLALLILWSLITFPPLSSLYPKPLLNHLEWIYLCGFLPLELYHIIGHQVLFGASLPFLPLLLISTYSTFGILYSWAILYRHHLISDN